MSHVNNVATLLLLVFSCGNSYEINPNEFPKDFLFGVASSAYQIEGAHNLNGKGVNIFDYYLEKNPKVVRDESNGNIACDSYHKYKEDVQLIKELGVDYYRFSISWTRILPTGYANEVNEDGVNYYNNLINELIANGIQPMVTMFHWDLPKTLQDIGGWANPLLVNYFRDYAEILFKNFGDRVKYWITFNSICHGYDSDEYPPFLNHSAIGNYMCKHVLLLAHAEVYHLYNDVYRSTQKGKIGITFDDNWYAPLTESSENIAATERAREFILGSFINPIFHKDGDYPQSVKERVEKLSLEEGFPRSRLPKFTDEEIKFVRNTYDFMGVNMYTTFLVKDIPEIQSKTPSNRKDWKFDLLQNKNWPGSASEWLKVTPSGIRNAMNWIKNKYGNVDIFITENGFSDTGELDDVKRIEFYQQYMSALLDAIEKDHVNIKGYTAWSLLDNFEWLSGYTEKFGLYHVDFNDPNRKRTAKKSAKWYKKTVNERRIISIDEMDHHEEL